MTNYTPRIERSDIDFTVSSNFTGTNGSTGRTYTLQWSGSIIQGLSIVVDGAILTPNNGISFASGIITFTNTIYDDQTITINYFTTSTSTTETGHTSYATTEELSEFMVMVGEIPNPQIKSDTRLLEVVGLGDSSTTRFYLDNAYVLANTYTLYYGASESTALTQPLTETTHYTLDKDLGIITLTATGVTLISTNNIYATYKYNSIGFKDSELQDQLNRAGSRISKDTNNYWTDGTIATPDWKVVTDEVYEGRGAYNRSYFLKPHSITIPDVSTTLASDATIGDTTLTVVSTNGFPESGYLNINSEKITYSAKTSNTFTVTAITAAHTSGDNVLPFVFEASNTLEGASPTWTVLSQGDDYHLDKKTGRVYFSATGLNVTDAQAYDLNPPKGIPNRFRASFIWGNDEIPYNIKQLTLMIASADLLHRAVRKAHVNGLNDYNPSLVNVDEDWINKTIRGYKQAPMAVTVGRQY